VGPRHGTAVVLEDLADHRRVEDEGHDPHRRPEVAAQQIYLEQLRDETVPGPT
jgi:hypothetical protein